MIGTFCDVGLVFTDGDGLPSATDYLPPLMADPSFVGAWRFDDPSAYTISGGKISALANWKPGGPSLVQATPANQATLAFDPVLNRNVGVFSASAPTFYNLSGATINSAGPLTYVMVLKPSNYAPGSGISILMGDGGYAHTNSLALAAGAPPLFEMSIDNQTIGASTPDQINWRRLMASNNGSRVPTLSVDGGAPAVGVAGSAASNGTSLQVGNSTASIAYAGYVDWIGLFSSDLFAGANAALLATVTACLTARGT